ncbi:MAG: hypothetical protein GX050_04705 [Firmicutes bacterium]|nr:hypothetical protein [Bacillota bacterium]
MSVKKLKRLLFMLLVLLTLSSIASGAEYFLFDAEENQILFMDEDDLSFSKTISMEKVPDLLMKTADPDKYLAIYGPDPAKESAEKGNFFANLFKTKEAEEKKSGIAGQLILFNVKTGRTEDLVELGFAPFNWEYSEDRQHFFITYRVSEEQDSAFELLKYNITEMTCATIELPELTKRVNQLEINQELDRLYLLLDNEDRISGKNQRIIGQPQLLAVNIRDFKVEESFGLDHAPLSFYILGKNKGVVTCQDWAIKSYYVNGKLQWHIDVGRGSITLLDLQTQKPLEKYKVDEGNIYWQWFTEEQIYIGHYQSRESRTKRNYHFLKITGEGVESKDLTAEPLNFGYYPEDDKLYILHKDTISIIDYQINRTANYKTGNNLYKEHPYTFRKIPATDLAVIYSNEEGKVKFYDLKKNKVERKALSGRTWGKVAYLFKTIITKPTGAMTMITANAEQDKLYVYNRMSNDITVYNRSFQPEEYVVTPEPAYGIYQITEPTMKTLVFTGKNLYELVDNELDLLHSFEKKTDRFFVASEKNRVIIASETELLVLEPETLKTENHIKFFVGRDEKYTKLKAGDQRYFFIQTL